jgi:glycosyltransferase involved in cell wall biosynthesis
MIWRLRSKAGRAIGIAAARRASAIVVKSRNLFEALPQELSSKATILPNGVDTEFFRPMDMSECRSRLGWSLESKIVLFNASYAVNKANKNPELAQRTMVCASSLVPGIIMKTMSKNTRDEVRLMLNAADCLLVTSLHEGSPNVVKEAMACNLPVVSVNCGDVAERLRRVVPSALCDYDPQALARAIAGIVSRSVRSNGREEIEAQGLSAYTVAERLIQLYYTVLQQRCAESQEFLS